MGAYQHGKQALEMPFIDFAPDLAYDAGQMKGVVLIDMDNAMPTQKGYQCLNSLQPYPPGVPPTPEKVLGSTIAYFSDGTAKIYFGGPSQLWRLDGTSWTPVGTFGAQATTARWRFSQWGDDVIAVNAGGGWLQGGAGGVKPPVIAPLRATGATGTFTILGGGYDPSGTYYLGYPPQNATTVVSVGGAVLMFAGTQWASSAPNTDTDWTPDVQTQAGLGSIYDFPGDIVAAAPLFRNVVVFKETGMWLGTYTGSYAVWSWQLLSSMTGTWCQECVVPMPDGLAFIGMDDFYTCVGWAPQRIPNSLKEWFFDVVDPTALNFIQSRYDALHAVVYWYFVSKRAPFPQVPDRYVAWNSRTGKWAAGYIPEHGSYSVPYPNEQPGILSGLMFTADGILRSWTGAPGVARYETGYFGLPQITTQAMRARPMYYVKPDWATVVPYHVRSLGDPDIMGPMSFLNQRDGWHYFRQYDAWHRLQVTTTGPNVIPDQVSMTGAEVSAIAIDFRPGGWR